MDRYTDVWANDGLGNYQNAFNEGYADGGIPAGGGGGGGMAIPVGQDLSVGRSYSRSEWTARYLNMFLGTSFGEGLLSWAAANIGHQRSPAADWRQLVAFAEESADLMLSGQALPQWMQDRWALLAQYESQRGLSTVMPHQPMSPGGAPAPLPTPTPAPTPAPAAGAPPTAEEAALVRYWASGAAPDTDWYGHALFHHEQRGVPFNPHAPIASQPALLAALAQSARHVLGEAADVYTATGAIPRFRAWQGSQGLAPRPAAPAPQPVAPPRPTGLNPLPMGAQAAGFGLPDWALPVLVGGGILWVVMRKLA